MKNSIAYKNSHGGDFQISDIFDAVKKVDVNSIRSILNKNPEMIFETSSTKEFPVSYACFIGNLTSVEVLFEYIDVSDPKYFPMLDKALIHSLALSHEPLTAFLDEKLLGWKEFTPNPSSPKFI